MLPGHEELHKEHGKKNRKTKLSLEGTEKPHKERGEKYTSQFPFF